MTKFAPNLASRPEPITDNTLRQFQGYRIKRAFMVIQSDLTRVLNDLDLRMLTYSTLLMIVENPGLRQSQLSDALKIERPNLVVIIDELESRGLILRERMEHDRRAYALLPTLEGNRLAQKAVDAVRIHEARLTAGISDEELAQLNNILARIERNGASA